MITKFRCGETTIYAEKFYVKPSPTSGGVGHVNITDICDSIWTGDTHLYFAKGSEVLVFIGDITSIETRSSLDEDNESWVIHFSRCPGIFSYERERNLTKIIEDLARHNTITYKLRNGEIKKL